MQFQSIYRMYEDLKESVLLESKQDFLKKNALQKDVKSLVDKFWNQIRQRVKAPKNDIDWWMNQPFEEFKFFVNSFDLRNKEERRETEILRKADDAGAVKLGVWNDQYEMWYVPNYESACLIGRNYKGRPSHWCITSDDPEWWFDKYEDSEFVFLVRQKPVGDEYDKVAIQFADGGRYFNVDDIRVWRLDDEDDYDPSIVPDDLLRYCWELFKDNGQTREGY